MVHDLAQWFSSLFYMDHIGETLTISKYKYCTLTKSGMYL